MVKLDGVVWQLPRNFKGCVRAAWVAGLPRALEAITTFLRLRDTRAPAYFRTHLA
jgi:hypothetical protein